MTNLYCFTLAIALVVATVSSHKPADGTQQEVPVFNYCAEFNEKETNGLKGYFAMQIYSGKATYTYAIDGSGYTGVETCDLSNGLQYHIHDFWTNGQATSAEGGTGCSALVTGGHYDPNLACGYASRACTALGRNSSSNYQCTPANYDLGKYALCQVGDLSGKFGLAFETEYDSINFMQKELLTDYQPAYAANYLKSDVISSPWSSIVFHCSTGARLLCAKFELIESGQTSVCKFPEHKSQSMHKPVFRGPPLKINGKIVPGKHTPYKHAPCEEDKKKMQEDAHASKTTKSHLKGSSK